MNIINLSPPILAFDESSNKGTLFDTRDGQSYQVVKIGNQIWLAENFRYLPSLEKGDKYENSWVYNNDNSYLDKGYERLYDYYTANSIAPEGWRLPKNQDFIELRDFIIEDNNLNNNEVGNYLRSVNGWEKPSNIGPNNDKYGFNAKPAGYYNSGSNYFINTDINASFWSTTTDNNRDNINYWSLYYGSGGFYSHNNFNLKNYEFSVRLIKDP